MRSCAQHAGHHPATRVAKFQPGQTPLAGRPTSGFLGFLDPGAARPARQNQWSIGVQREITPNTVLEAAYVGNRGVWWPRTAQAISTRFHPRHSRLSDCHPYTNPTDNLLLGSAL